MLIDQNRLPATPFTDYGIKKEAVPEYNFFHAHALINSA
jgi:hypothetical protein